MSNGEEGKKVRCERMGCNAFFTPSDNPDKACRYHPGPPLFHDGGKQWSCCKQRSHDFSLFLDLPGCTEGKHTTEKPQIKLAPSPNKPIQGSSQSLDNVKASCSRCRQGFFCSDHGSNSELRVGTPDPVPKVIPAVDLPKGKPAVEVPKVTDLDATQVCKNKGCGKTFTERENHEAACKFHPGPPVFHDRSKGWGCCDIHVKEFEEFLEIAPCTKGWHNANPEADLSK